MAALAAIAPLRARWSRLPFPFLPRFFFEGVSPVACEGFPLRARADESDEFGNSSDSSARALKGKPSQATGETPSKKNLGRNGKGRRDHLARRGAMAARAAI